MRTISPKRLLRELPDLALGVGRCVSRFKRPATVLKHYAKRTPPESGVVELRDGLRIFLSDHPHDIVTVVVIFAREDYGKIRAGSVVVDIGANIGTFSLYAAHCGASKVYAYEPGRRAYEALVRNIERNGLEKVVMPFNLAVSDRDGGTVRIPSESSPYNAVLSESSEAEGDVVRTISLPTILQSNGLRRVDLLKVDCEGSEYPLFRQTDSETLARIDEIRIEYHPGPLDELLERFAQERFKTVRLERSTAMLWVERADPAVALLS